jgi:hypothetical protein
MVPTVNVVYGDGDATAEQIVAAMDDLGNSVPFGMSPMTDALAKAVEVVGSNDQADVSKVVYVLTDQDHVAQKEPEAEVVENLISTGDDGVPVVFIDLRRYEPLASPSTQASAMNPEMDRIADATQGATYAVISTSNLNTVVTDAMSRVRGSVGYGVFDYVFDLRESSLITELSMSFDVSGGSAEWRYAFSDDGFEYTDWSGWFDHDEVAVFSETMTRYVKVRAKLIAAFATTESPLWNRSGSGSTRS